MDLIRHQIYVGDCHRALSCNNTKYGKEYQIIADGIEYQKTVPCILIYVIHQHNLGMSDPSHIYTTLQRWRMSMERKPSLSRERAAAMTSA